MTCGPGRSPCRDGPGLGLPAGRTCRAHRCRAGHLNWTSSPVEVLGSGGDGAERRDGLMRDGRVPGLWAPQTRALTAGLILSVTSVASEALAVVTVMPVVAGDLGGLRLYGWVFSAVMLGSVVGIVAGGAGAHRRGAAGA